jgi:hypothetical protein
MLKKKIWASFQRIIERDPGSGKKPIPDPGSSPGVKKAPDPGSGSASLLERPQVGWYGASDKIPYQGLKNNVF